MGERMGSAVFKNANDRPDKISFLKRENAGLSTAANYDGTFAPLMNRF